MDPGQESPETLEQLTSLATSFVLHEGQRLALDLVLSSY